MIISVIKILEYLIYDSNLYFIWFNFKIKVLFDHEKKLDKLKIEPI